MTRLTSLISSSTRTIMALAAQAFVAAHLLTAGIYAEPANTSDVLVTSPFSSSNSTSIFEYYVFTRERQVYHTFEPTKTSHSNVTYSDNHGSISNVTTYMSTFLPTDVSTNHTKSRNLTYITSPVYHPIPFHTSSPSPSPSPSAKNNKTTLHPSPSPSPLPSANKNRTTLPPSNSKNPIVPSTYGPSSDSTHQLSSISWETLSAACMVNLCVKMMHA